MQKRIYPAACTSMYCGEIKCPEDCRFLPALREFEEWRDRTGAVQSDPVWAPNVWVAQEDK